MGEQNLSFAVTIKKLDKYFQSVTVLRVLENEDINFENKRERIVIGVET